MEVDREHRAVFTEQLRQRRRGRPRGSTRKVPKCVYLPEAVLDVFCRRALAERKSVNAVISQALVALVARSTNVA